MSLRGAAARMLFAVSLACAPSACGSDGHASGRSGAGRGAPLPLADDPPDPEPPPPQSAPPDVDLGALPEGLEVPWPEQPRVRREIDVRDATTAAAAARRAGSRLRVHADLDEVTVRADDVELRVDEGVRIGRVLVARGRHRIRITGGRYGTIELAVPAQHVPPPPEFRPAWRVTDVTIEGVEVDAEDTAFFLRGQRLALVDSTAEAERYSVWTGDTDDFHSEDLILAGNRLTSAGPESTVRLVDVRRAVVVDNVLSNTRKHDFRVHGDSDAVFFGRNTLLNTGIMVGSMEGDEVGTVWLVDNTFHHDVPSLLQAPPARIERLVARGNRVFSDRWDCLVCSRGDGWEVEGNRVEAYRPPDGSDPD
ncbi:MAG TPA: hypothetical protein RMH99_24600 [Sandaracinaceae bacterium LLY-WYZ-13_1]|nr:hypothetical protein [Sandaracinaceae bacterium LLY-WYZ-13_1]